MFKDKFDQIVLTEDDICSLYYKDPDSVVKFALTNCDIKFDDSLDLDPVPSIIPYQNLDHLTVDQFDRIHSTIWKMPESYKNMDIAKWVLDQCNDQEELQRAGEELIMFQEREMFDLLRYLKYLVDLMREKNIIWGVGRGSSVASFVLFLIGIHRINSLYYQLDITEFLK